MQTLLSYQLFRVKPPPSKDLVLTLNDHDTLICEVSTPTSWKSSDHSVILLHGTAGSSSSPYMERIALRFFEKGFRVYRLNFRGLGKGVGLAKKIAHAGFCDDIRFLMEAIEKQTPESLVIAIGFSLGGQMLINYALTYPYVTQIKKIIAIAPPLNLNASSQRLEKRANRIYKNSILKTLVDIATSPKSSFEFHNLSALKKCQSLKEFDDLFTAPLCGFKDALDYYNTCSTHDKLKEITYKTHILFSKDDPLIDSTFTQPNQYPDHLQILKTNYGGHMGYLNSFYAPSKNSPFWLDELILHWASKIP